MSEGTSNETDLLLTGGTVVTVDQDRRILTNGAVAVDGGKIVAVGPADEIGQFPWWSI